MKITFTLSQLIAFSELTKEEQRRVIDSCTAMLQMDEEALKSMTIDAEKPALVHVVHRKLLTRAARARRHQARKAAMEKLQSQADKEKRPELKDSLQHDVKTFERMFKDDFQKFISTHLRQLRKSLRDLSEETRTLIMVYAHSYMRRTIGANLPGTAAGIHFNVA